MIRLAQEEDLPILREIERAAGRAFAVIGMVAVAEDEPPSLERLRQFEQAGQAWVYTADDDLPVAYLIAEMVDGNVHIEQVSVHPNHAGRGIGRSLIEHVANWANDRGAPALTLTTFSEVAWNGPYYERIGFRFLPDSEVTPGLRAIRAAEAAHGLDRWPRACMRRNLRVSA
ncbi:GNAT family N-acetyltransferase [Hoyosella sp. YIM 151337]|uniref:GNAT family N-acetyltransferase n=1 Tax=Hoyosella sp. YIM 151337 TaxID=2992742 RepID=UPI00223680FA|nr:GNAT family N-acetyltransferase [Hoyosella sp. YIM 151337]MCW4356100.1 GNAT family N-acetyltransferase [Hoyosella sp. YIM 151337]